MAEKVTVMRLKVDLQCPCCYKKVKKILCKFPQIRDQVYDEKKNLVTITVVCCSPEKIRDKLCCKGCKVIKSIEIVPPPPPPKPKPPPPKPGPPPPRPEPTPPRPEPTPPRPQPTPPRPQPSQPSRPQGGPSVPEREQFKSVAPAPAPVIPPPPGPVLVEPCRCPPVPVGFCCVPCSEGHGGGPCYYGYGRPGPPPPCYDSYGYWYGCGKGYSRCDYFSEENTGGCSVM